MIDSGVMWEYRLVMSQLSLRCGVVLCCLSAQGHSIFFAPPMAYKIPI